MSTNVQCKSRYQRFKLVVSPLQYSGAAPFYSLRMADAYICTTAVVACIPVLYQVMSFAPRITISFLVTMLCCERVTACLEVSETGKLDVCTDTRWRNDHMENHTFILSYDDLCRSQATRYACCSIVDNVVGTYLPLDILYADRAFLFVWRL